VPKGREVKRALEKAGWVVDRRRGSHVIYRKAGTGGRVRTGGFSYHDADELGQTQLRFVAKKFGMTLEQLKELL
jgi:predicted RNA binding protein YcfA (HicA-like mRNA interferase family)